MPSFAVDIRHQTAARWCTCDRRLSWWLSSWVWALSSHSQTSIGRSGADRIETSSRARPDSLRACPRNGSRRRRNGCGSARSEMATRPLPSKATGSTRVFVEARRTCSSRSTPRPARASGNSTTRRPSPTRLRLTSVPGRMRCRRSSATASSPRAASVRSIPSTNRPVSRCGRSICTNSLVATVSTSATRRMRCRTRTP